MDGKKLIGKKRPHKNEGDGKSPESSGPVDVKKKKKIEETTGFHSPKKRRSDERWQNTSFLGVCLTCYQYGNSTIEEVSDFAYNHMCETETIEDDKKKYIEVLKEQIQKLENSVGSGSEARPIVRAKAKGKSTPLLSEPVKKLGNSVSSGTQAKTKVRAMAKSTAPPPQLPPQPPSPSAAPLTSDK